MLFNTLLHHILLLRQIPEKEESEEKDNSDRQTSI